MIVTAINKYDEYKKILASKSQRITIPRLKVLHVLGANSKPLTISEIHELLNKDSKKKIDLVTVYRILNLFVDLSLVAEVNFGDEFKRYEMLKHGHHHHHIVCKICNKVECLNICILKELEESVKQKGYSQITHSLEFFGICSSCAAKSSKSA